MALKSSPLANLPLDVLLEILSHLQTSAAATFSISCMQYKRLLGDIYLKALLYEPAAKTIFLLLLEKDLPEHAACKTCKKLHWLKNAQHFSHIKGRGTDELPACLYQELKTRASNRHIQKYIGRNLGRTIIRMARKRHRQDPQCRQILDIMGYDSSPRKPDAYIWQKKDTVYFSQGKLVVISQSVHIPTLSRTACTFPKRLPGITYISKHLYLASARWGAWVQNVAGGSNRRSDEYWRTNWNE